MSRMWDHRFPGSTAGKQKGQTALALDAALPAGDPYSTAKCYCTRQNQCSCTHKSSAPALGKTNH